MIKASRGAVRIPLPVLSSNLPSRTPNGPVAIPIIGLARVDKLYPKITKGLRLLILSEYIPVTSLRILAVPSANPSMIPTETMLVLRTVVRNIGTIG